MSIIVIWDDLSVQRPGYKRAYYADGPASTVGVTVFGYASALGSHKTVKAVIDELKRYGHDGPYYRNGKRVHETQI